MALFRDIVDRVRGTHRIKWQFEVIIHDVEQLPPTLEGTFVEVYWHRHNLQALTNERRVSMGSAKFNQSISLVFNMDRDDKKHTFMEKTCKFCIRDAKHHKTLSSAVLDLSAFIDKPKTSGSLHFAKKGVGSGANLKYTLFSKGPTDEDADEITDRSSGSEPIAIPSATRSSISEAEVSDSDSDLSEMSQARHSVEFSDSEHVLSTSAPQPSASFAKDSFIQPGSTPPTFTVPETPTMTTTPPTPTVQQHSHSSPLSPATAIPPLPGLAHVSQGSHLSTIPPGSGDGETSPRRSKSPRPSNVMSVPVSHSVQHSASHTAQHPSKAAPRATASDLTSIVAKLDQEVRDQTAKLRDAIQRQEDAEAAVAQLGIERQDLEGIVGNLKAQQCKLSEDCERLERKVEDWRAVILNLKRHADDLHTAVEPRQQQAKDLRKQVDALKQERSELRAEIERYRCEVPETRSRYWMQQGRTFGILLVVLAISHLVV
eukprot:TRINITY_DN9112_c0_g1_i1.p1 TRINITY_DN9112_c0_g1~~TRINITY_DN9112_c0_g1_i1.p1  ORF type:complete len:486 (+),score=80.50 TRINITY_DN9112_c0_g1_i1:143-1600(+)